MKSTLAVTSDLLAMLPQQWLGFAQRTRLLQQIRLAEELAAPAICMVHRVRLPLTPVAEHLSDLLQRAAVNRDS